MSSNNRCPHGFELDAGCPACRSLSAALANAGMPCDCWDSRCTQYAILLRRASFLMQTAAKGDADMRKFIDEIERLCGSPSTSASEQK
jgi:hypothetical protein